MKTTKLIPKHQVGKKILNFLQDFGNAQIAGDSGTGTSMAIASGYQYNPQTRKWEQSKENLKESENLRNNLAVLSTFSPTHPSSVLFKGLGYLFRWRPFLPKGSETTVYRQGGMDMVDDALNTGVIRPQPDVNYAAKVAADKATGQRMILRKQFSNVMFNRKHPFYGNPGLFEKTGNRGVFIGNMNKSSAQWTQNFHKGHKNIFEPFMHGTRQAPVSEFDIYTRAPFNFGWFKNAHMLDATTGKYFAIPSAIGGSTLLKNSNE